MKFLDEWLLRMFLVLCAIALTSGLLWPVFSKERMLWTWDFGAGVITLVATLVGVLAAFSLERALGRQMETERFAAELDAARGELAALVTSARRIRIQIENRQAMIEEFQAPSIVIALLQSSRFRLRASYSLVVCTTTIPSLADSLNVKIRECRKAPTAVNVSLMRAELSVVEKAAELVAEAIDDELRKVGIAAKVTQEERQQIANFRETLRATREAGLGQQGQGRS
jgi:hypothetical protein